MSVVWLLYLNESRQPLVFFVYALINGIMRFLFCFWRFVFIWIVGINLSAVFQDVDGAVAAASAAETRMLQHKLSDVTHLKDAPPPPDEVPMINATRLTRSKRRSSSGSGNDVIHSNHVTQLNFFTSDFAYVVASVVIFACVSAMFLNMCIFCNSCDDDKSTDEEKATRYIGQINLADIKVIYNPAACASPPPAPSQQTQAHNNMAFKNSQEDLVYQNAATLHIPQAETLKIRGGTSGQMTQGNFMTSSYGGDQENLSARPDAPYPGSVVDADSYKITFVSSKSSNVRTNENSASQANRNSASQANRNSTSQANRKLKDVYVDRGNKIALAYENVYANDVTDSAVTSSSDSSHVTLSDVTNKSKSNVHQGRDGNSKKSRGTTAKNNLVSEMYYAKPYSENISERNYDMNDIAIKNMYARY